MTVYIGVDLHVRTQAVCWMDTADGEIHEITLSTSATTCGHFTRSFRREPWLAWKRPATRCGSIAPWKISAINCWLATRWRYASSPAAGRKTTAVIPIWCSTCFAAAISPAIHIPLPPAATFSRCCAIVTGWSAFAPCCATACRPSLSAIACVSVPDCSPPAGYSGLPPCRSTALSPFSDSTPCFYSFPWPNKSRPSKTNSNGARKTILASRLRTHPGIGPLTSLAVVHALDPVTRFDRARHVAAYCGLDPREHSSGDTQRLGHISKQGNRLLRFLLIEAAHNAIRNDDDLRRFYFHLQARKNSSVAIVAVARKLVLRLYRMLRDEIDYEQFRRRGQTRDVPVRTLARLLLADPLMGPSACPAPRRTERSRPQEPPCSNR